MEIDYPLTRKGTDESRYFDRTVPDPFRWLEDDTSPEVEEWVAAQNRVTFRYLSRIPFRDSLRRRLTRLWDHPRYGTPFVEGEWRYYGLNRGLQNQHVIMRDRPGREPEVFLDPNTFSSDGTTSLGGIGFSPDGTMAAYQVSEGGADWRTVRVISTEAPDRVLETLDFVKFSGLSWRGNLGFYYSSYPRPSEGGLRSGVTERHRLMFHRLGTPQSSDEMVFGGDDTPRRYISGRVTEDGRWLVISAAMTTTGNELYALDLSRPEARIVPLVTGFEKEHRLVHGGGDHLFIRTTLDAPNGRLVRLDMDSPERGDWVDVIGERRETLQANFGGGYFFAVYLKDALSVVEQVDQDGSPVRRVSLPGQGTAWGFQGKEKAGEVYYGFTSYIHPWQIFSLDPGSGESRLFSATEVDFDPSGYESRQVFYPSFDGTRIPMMVTHRKGLPLDGKNPLLLQGYGGFGASLTPVFSVSGLVWIENGGVLAVPNLRGGGEYGEEWHLAGTRLRKTDVFDDFTSAAEYLIRRGYTSPEKLAIQGASNGGLLVGAAMTRRPELFRVAMPAVGVLDMLRYHTFTAGAGWSYDYGTAEESREMFEYLLGYSPLHAIRDGTAYPATLITTADRDDRVVPAHSFKFAARLQEARGGNLPALLRVDVKAGHGMGKPLSMVIEGEADRLAFAMWNLGVTPSC